MKKMKKLTKENLTQSLKNDQSTDWILISYTSPVIGTQTVKISGKVQYTSNSHIAFIENIFSMYGLELIEWSIIPRGVLAHHEHLYVQIMAQRKV